MCSDCRNSRSLLRFLLRGGAGSLTVWTYESEAITRAPPEGNDKANFPLVNLSSTNLDFAYAPTQMRSEEIRYLTSLFDRNTRGWNKAKRRTPKKLPKLG